MANEEYRWRCQTCCVEWSTAACINTDHCPNCGARQVKPRGASAPEARPGVVDTALRTVDAMLAAHRAEMRSMVDSIVELTLRDRFAELAMQVLPPSVLIGTNDEIAKAAYDLADAMLRRRAHAEAGDTERPPPPAEPEPEFTPEEANTFDPVVTTLGRMVGVERHETPAELRWERTADDGIPKDGEEGS